jgi:tetratricopeptide (TPR) repeat protein
MNVYMSLNRLARDLGRVAEAADYYERVMAIGGNIGFSEHPVILGFRRENEGQPELPPEAGALAAAVGALLTGVHDEESFRDVLSRNPALIELPALRTVVGLATTAQAQGGAEGAAQVVVLSLLLFSAYTAHHNEAIDPGEQTDFLALHEALLPVAASLATPELAVAVRESAVWAGNTLGNHHASTGDHTAAVAAYSRSLEYQPDQALVLRNRAGTLINLGEFTRARADLERAAALEPDAARLAELWRQLEEGEGEGHD